MTGVRDRTTIGRYGSSSRTAVWLVGKVVGILSFPVRRVAIIRKLPPPRSIAHAPRGYILAWR